MSVKSLISQQDRAQTDNLPNAPKFAAGKVISEKTLAEFKRIEMGKFSDLLIGLWGNVKLESPVYKKVDVAFLTENRDNSGLLYKNHLKRRWKFASPSTNRQTFYNMKNFFDFLRIRNEPVDQWDIGSVLIFFGHRRNILLEQYDLRVEKQNC